MRAYSNSEFIKVFRKLLDWEWYKDTNTKVLFIHCLLRANWKPGTWQGISYNAGEFITSIPSLAKETGLSEKAVKTAINKLVKTGELGSKTYDERAGKRLPKCRVITVKNWDDYQSKGRQKVREGTDSGTVKGPTTGPQYKNNKELEEDKKYKKRARVQIEQHEYDFEAIDRALTQKQAAMPVEEM